MPFRPTGQKDTSTSLFRRSNATGLRPLPDPGCPPRDRGRDGLPNRPLHQPRETPPSKAARLINRNAPTECHSALRAVSRGPISWAFGSRPNNEVETFPRPQPHVERVSRPVYRQVGAPPNGPGDPFYFSLISGPSQALPRSGNATGFWVLSDHPGERG